MRTMRAFHGDNKKHQGALQGALKWSVLVRALTLTAKLLPLFGTNLGEPRAKLIAKLKT